LKFKSTHMIILTFETLT